MASVVQQQEYSSESPPSWFGYDSEGNPLEETHTKVKTYSEMIVKESLSSDDETPNSKHH